MSGFLIRADWPRVRAKWLFERAERPANPDDGIITAFRDGTVTLRSNRRTEGFTNAIEEIGYHGIRRADLVIHSMDAFAGAIGVSDSDGKASPVAHNYKAPDGVDPRYYAYLLRSFAHSGFIASLAKGIRERSTAFDPETFLSLELPVPPTAVQKTIADFLDRETTRINALIAAKRKMIELLEERYRSEVSFAVAEGSRCQVRRVTSLRTSGPRGWADRVGDNGLPFIRSANLRRDDIDLRSDNLALVNPSLNEEAVRSLTRPGDVLIGITGANTGWVGLVSQSNAGGFVSQHVAILRPAGVLPGWLAYTLFSHQVQDQLLSGQYGGTKQQLGLEDLAELWINRPSLARQSELVTKLAHSKAIAVAATQALATQIDLLAERRLGMNAAAVTGALDIPGVAV